MRTLASLLLLAVLAYIVRTYFRQYQQARQVELRARRRRMEVEHDRQVCNVLKLLPLSEASND